MSTAPRRRGLAKGLSALLDDDSATGNSADSQASPSPSRTLPVDRLHPSPFQPRRRFEPELLETLAQSIREKGLVQPILVREDPDQPGHYEIVAGERRWRACQMAQLHEVPVVIRALDDRDALEIAIIENLQRENLTPIEEAEAYRRLTDEFGGTQEEVAQAVGKSRSHVANSLRLLSLPESVRDLLDSGALSAGHARALIGTTSPEALARDIVKRGLNVRQAEKLSRDADRQRPVKRRSPERDADIVALENDLGRVLGLSVAISHQGERGELKIAYRSLEQLDEVIRRLRGAPF
ncbi:MAG: chromosome partitioning protein ParB [Rhodospirillaceae bacterium]|jgi:ParB family chromosome partitioning protein|nr:chromosome partitioning protein ParB [Rhodospirillaceae bacterium]